MVAPDRLVSPLVGLMSGRGIVGRAIVGQDIVGRGKISPQKDVIYIASKLNKIVSVNFDLKK